MFENLYKKSGVVLFIVLGMLLIVVALAGVILNIIRSQARFTHHQASRIQAYYASQAGINYALEQLRQGNANWIPSPDTSPNERFFRLCRSGCDINDPDLPNSIEDVSIVVEANGTGINGTRRIRATAEYSYPAPGVTMQPVGPGVPGPS